MSDFQQYKTNDTATVAFDRGIRMRLRSRFHPKMRQFEEHLSRKYRPYNMRGSPPAEIQDQMNCERFAAAIEWWEGVTGPDGQALPLTYDNAKQVLTADPWLRQDVMLAFVNREAFEEEDLAELGKSSALSSDASSNTPTETTSSGD